MASDNSTSTLILDINELYKVIPEVRSLEGKNFNHVKELLLNLIARVEESGHWEFVQYINVNPSLFIIRKVNTAVSLKKLQEIESIRKDVQRMYDKILSPTNDSSHWDHPLNSNHHYDRNTILPEVTFVDNPEYKVEIIENRTDEVKLPETKLPWE